jgi:hypothetical protein
MPSRGLLSSPKKASFSSLLSTSQSVQTSLKCWQKSASLISTALFVLATSAIRCAEVGVAGATIERGAISVRAGRREECRCGRPARVGGHRSVRAGRGGGLEVLKEYDQNWDGRLSGFERLHRR